MAASAAAAAACLVVVVVVVPVGRDSDSGRDGGAGRGRARYNNDKVSGKNAFLFGSVAIAQNGAQRRRSIDMFGHVAAGQIKNFSIVFFFVVTLPPTLLPLCTFSNYLKIRNCLK